MYNCMTSAKQPRSIETDRAEGIEQYNDKKGCPGGDMFLYIQFTIAAPCTEAAGVIIQKMIYSHGLIEADAVV